MYDKICEFGSQIKKSKDSKDVKEEGQVKNAFLKNMPGHEDIKDFISQEFINIETFIKMYVDVLDVELDSDIVWPMNWHLNV